MQLFEKPVGVVTRWFSPENPSGEPGNGGLENLGSKGRPFVSILAGESHTLIDFAGSGTICRIWVTIGDRSPEMLRGLKIEMFWDGCDVPAVSVPFGDFFGIGLGRRTPFECALFSDPEGRSFNCLIPMPFRFGSRVVLTNESGKDLLHCFYDVDALVGMERSAETLYFHSGWRREAPNALGEEFSILPSIAGSGRFLGCNIGVITDPRYEGSWWGEGEVKVRIGGESTVTLCGTGTEDYIGTAWGQGHYTHRTQGCLIADEKNGHWAFYRYHLDDPVYFDGGVQVSIQTIGGTSTEKVIGFMDAGLPAIPVSIDNGQIGQFRGIMHLPQPVDLMALSGGEGWSNFWRQDDWSATSYFYLDKPGGVLPPLQMAAERMAGLAVAE